MFEGTTVGVITAVIDCRLWPNMPPPHYAGAVLRFCTAQLHHGQPCPPKKQLARSPSGAELGQSAREATLMKLQIVPIDSAMLAALFVLVLSGCASANLNPEEERRLQQDHAELNRQVVAGYKGSGVAPPSGTQSEHRVPTATSRRTTVSVIGTEPSSLVSEIMQGTMVFYRQTGRWPTSREEVELGLKQLPKFLHTAHVVLKNKGDHLMVEFSADDGLRGSLTVRTPR